MKAKLFVSIDRDLLENILEGAKQLYPKETILLLRGKKQDNAFKILELVIPPLATYGLGFASIPLNMLPIDFSIIGSAHSHPSGNLNPSNNDLNHFIGHILMIIGFPFLNEKNISIYSRNGERLNLMIRL